MSCAVPTTNPRLWRRLLWSGWLVLLWTSPVHAQTSGIATAYSVTYFDVTAAAAAATADALRQYRNASRHQAGYVDIQLLEQLERAGHFVVIEIWRDAAALAAQQGSARQQQLQARLQPLRISSYYQRDYHPLAAVSVTELDASAVIVVTHIDIGNRELKPNDPKPEAVLAQSAITGRSAAGNLSYSVLQGTRTNHYTMVAAWNSMAAYVAHAAAAGTRQFRNHVEPMTGSPIDERLFRVIP